MSTAVEEKTKPAGPALGDSWKVIVLNDNHNSFQGVARILSTVLPSTSYEQGMALAEKIHREGLAIVWSGMREPAELYWEMLKNAGLTMAPLES